MTQPSGRQAAAQDGQAAGGLDGSLDGPEDLLPGRLLDGCRDLRERLAGDGRGVAVHEARLEELADDDADAAGVVDVGGASSGRPAAGRR